MPSEGARRDEILQTAASLFASSGVRTSLGEISDACGILPGSLYHHFDSKEAIIVELVQRYQDDLRRIAKEARDTLHEPVPRPLEVRITEFGRAIAAVGLEHRAALLLTLYEPPPGTGEESGQALQSPPVIHDAMEEILHAGRTSGEIRPNVDLSLLADRMCQSTLHVGVGISHVTPGGEVVPDMRIRILLDGLAVRSPSNASLEASVALEAARAAISSWKDEDKSDDDRLVHLRSVARQEFGRHGYEATTMRDIASASGLSTGTVYRLLGSKDELLVSIMSSYVDKVVAAWDAVAGSDSSSLSKIDALIWVSINVLHTLSEEFKIMLAWLRQSPPTDTPSLGLLIPQQLRHVRAVLAAGARDGEIRLEGGSSEIRARCVLETIWGAGSYVTAVAPREAHALARNTVLRGAAARA